MKKINVLISSAGSTPAISVIKALRKQKELDVNIIAVDMGKYSAGFQLADEHCIVPASNDPSFIPKIKEICEEKKISVVIPIIDEELVVFAAEKKAFNDELGVKILVNDLEVIKRAINKEETAKFCKANRIIHPETANLASFDPVKFSNFMFPLLVKPRFGRGSVNIYTVKNLVELRNLPIAVTNDSIIQEFVEGTEYTVDILASLEGKILQAIPRERIVVKAGQIFKGRVVKDQKLMNLAKEVAKKFGINGPCNIQFIGRDSEFHLIEVNPKFAAGLPLTVEAGVNIPLLLIQMHLGLKAPQNLTQKEIDFEHGCYMMRYWEEKYLFPEREN